MLLKILKIWISFAHAVATVVKAWDSTMEFFSNMWDGTKEAFSNAGTWIKKYLDMQPTGLKISGSSKEFFSGLWDSTKKAQKIHGKILNKRVADSAKSVESFKNGFDNVKDWFKGVGKSISDVFTTAFDFVWKYIGPYVTGIKNAFKMVVNAMKANIENVEMMRLKCRHHSKKCSISSNSFHYINDHRWMGRGKRKHDCRFGIILLKLLRLFGSGLKISFITLLQLFPIQSLLFLMD